MFKRLFDILVSALGLFMLAPVFLVIAILLKREDNAPVFYRGSRMGKGGNIFGILKFRTMHERPESYNGSRITAKGDKRITPLGQWLRDTKINELPQLWNVLIGDMSLVGPRPEDPEIVKTWDATVRDEILSIRPGITSPSSVIYHNEEKLLDPNNIMGHYLESILPDKLRLDLLYARHHNLLTDLDAIFWTFVLFIPRIGKSKVSEGWLFGGPMTRAMQRYIKWFVIDFFIALVGIGAVGVLWRVNEPLDVGYAPAFAFAVLGALAFGVSNTILGLKSVSWDRPAAEDVLRLLFSCVLVIVFYILICLYASEFPRLPINFVMLSGAIVLFGFVIVRYRLRLLSGIASRWIAWRNNTVGTGERVLIIGAGEGGEFASWILGRPDFRQYYQVIGIADDHPSKQGLRFDGYPVLGTTGDIPDLVKRYDIGVIFYAINKISAEDSQRILSACRKTNLPIVMISDVIDMLHQQLSQRN